MVMNDNIYQPNPTRKRRIDKRTTKSLNFSPCLCIYRSLGVVHCQKPHKRVFTPPRALMRDDRQHRSGSTAGFWRRVPSSEFSCSDFRSAPQVKHTKLTEGVSARVFTRTSGLQPGLLQVSAEVLLQQRQTLHSQTPAVWIRIAFSHICAHRDATTRNYY